jgi:hypothetical protein
MFLQFGRDDDDGRLPALHLNLKDNSPACAMKNSGSALSTITYGYASASWPKRSMSRMSGRSKRLIRGIDGRSCDPFLDADAERLVAVGLHGHHS